MKNDTHYTAKERFVRTIDGLQSYTIKNDRHFSSLVPINCLLRLSISEHNFSHIGFFQSGNKLKILSSQRSFPRFYLVELLYGENTSLQRHYPIDFEKEPKLYFRLNKVELLSNRIFFCASFLLSLSF
jgi:hypothetical protein